MKTLLAFLLLLTLSGWATSADDAPDWYLLLESVDINDDPVYNWSDPPCRRLGQRRDNDYKSVPEAR